MKRDSKVLKLDLYGCSGIPRTKNKVSENSRHFNTILVGEKQGRNSNKFSEVGVLVNKTKKFNNIFYFIMILFFIKII